MIEKEDNPRAEIDAIDDELLRLLNKRTAIALRVGEKKRRNDSSLCDHNRELEVLTRLCRQNQGPLDEQGVTGIFQRIIDESLQVQQRAFQSPQKSEETKILTKNFNGKERVAFLGARGTFSEEAAKKLLGESCETVSRPTFEELFTAIDEGVADYILAPFENSLIGSVHRCHDLLLESSLNIAAEIILPIAHFLIGCDGASLETVKIVESHPVALAQCERFFAANPHIKRVATNDTASSVRRVVKNGDVSRAAIAGQHAADIYKGSILKEHLADHAENYTRFILLTQNPEVSETGQKISLVIKLAHRPGALHDALRPFVRRGIDLLKIESRPVRESPWQYNFYLDVQAPASESELRGALAEIREQAETVRYLGRYSSVKISKDK